MERQRDGAKIVGEKKWVEVDWEGVGKSQVEGGGGKADENISEGKELGKQDTPLLQSHQQRPGR